MSDYRPDGETLRRFLLDESLVKGIRGPIGSGKSVACCIEVFRRAAAQAPDATGWRRSRWAIIRNTNPQLKTTTIKTWLHWFPEDRFGRFNWAPPYTHHIKVGDPRAGTAIDLEVLFVPLDSAADVRKLLSLDLTGVWINEAREIEKTILDNVIPRTNRYPGRADGGCTWHGVIMDSNSMDDDHWWPIVSGEAAIPEWMSEEDALALVRPDNWSFYTQPPAMLERRDQTGRIGYVMNPMAENLNNLPVNYYHDAISGKTKQWIDMYVMNRLGLDITGRPVYSNFNLDFHVAKHPIPFRPDLGVLVGCDFGLTPAGVILQRMPNGSYHVLKEVVTTDTGARRFARAMKTAIMARCPNAKSVQSTGDPAGDQRSSTDETTVFQILRDEGFPVIPAYSNDPAIRIETVDSVLGRAIDGAPGLLVDPSCKVLIKGFAGGYTYARMAGDMNQHEPRPDKRNRYSHIHDALQYALLGAGEGRRALRTKEAQVVNVRVDRPSPLERRGWSERNARIKWDRQT